MNEPVVGYKIGNTTADEKKQANGEWARERLYSARQAGFTLIELIMVIVILGVLSAFALPKFADLSGNAEVSAVEGALSAVRAASGITHAQSLATSTVNGDITLEGVTVTLVNGYPDHIDIDDAAGFTCGTIGTAGDQDYDCALDAGNDQVIVTLDEPQDGDPCFVYNESAAANVAPVITAVFQDTSGNGIGGWDAAGAGDADDTCVTNA